MLARSRRLSDARGFARVRRQGRACNHALLVVVSTPTGVSTADQEAPTRVGFSVSKRVGGAVVRNLVKRRLRAVVAGLLPNLSPNYDIVIIARPALADASFQDLAVALSSTLRRARLLHTETGLHGT